MTRIKTFTAQRWPYINRAGRQFVITKGNTPSSRFYLTDPETGRYLSSKGLKTLLEAQIDAEDSRFGSSRSGVEVYD